VSGRIDPDLHALAAAAADVRGIGDHRIDRERRLRVVRAQRDARFGALGTLEDLEMRIHRPAFPAIALVGHGRALRQQLPLMLEPEVSLPVDEGAFHLAKVDADVARVRARRHDEVVFELAVAAMQRDVDARVHVLHVQLGKVRDVEDGLRTGIVVAARDECPLRVHFRREVRPQHAQAHRVATLAQLQARRDRDLASSHHERSVTALRREQHVGGQLAVVALEGDRQPEQLGGNPAGVVGGVRAARECHGYERDQPATGKPLLPIVLHVSSHVTPRWLKLPRTIDAPIGNIHAQFTAYTPTTATPVPPATPSTTAV
jgi:hypothetical protein